MNRLPLQAAKRRGVLGILCGLLVASGNPTLAEADSELPAWSSWTAAQEAALGFRHLDLGQHNRAEQAAERAILLDPDADSSWRLLGACAVRRGAWSDARRAADRLLELDPADFGTLVWAGHVAVEEGDAAAARRFFRRASSAEPSQPAGPLGLALVAARLDGDFEQMAQELAAATSRDAALDLSSLPLQQGWTPLASEPSFLDALQAVMRPRR